MTKRQVLIYEAKCSLCGQKIQGATEEETRTKLVSHIDNECTAAATMRSWEEQGIYKEMMSAARDLGRAENLDKALHKLLKKYSIDEIQHALEMIEMMEDEQDG